MLSRSRLKGNDTLKMVTDTYNPYSEGNDDRASKLLKGASHSECMLCHPYFQANRHIRADST